MVSYLGVDNNARTQSGVVSVAGVNFGNFDFTPSARLDTNDCVTAAWTSFTSLACENVNNPTIHSVEVTLSAFVGTRYPQFTFDGARVTYMWSCPCGLLTVSLPAPVVSDSLSPNRPFSTSLSVTISGLNFNYQDVLSVDTTPTTQVALGSCDTSSWLSGTSLQCMQLNTGTPADRTIAVTAAGLVSTMIPAFTFDGARAPAFPFPATAPPPSPRAAPAVSARGLFMNIAASVVTSTLSVIGLNFAFTDYTPSGRLGSVACSTTHWTASTAVFCLATVADPMTVTVGGVVGTITLSFTFDGFLFRWLRSRFGSLPRLLTAPTPAPVVSFQSTENVAITSGGSLTVSGLDFRTADYTPSSSLDSSLCGTLSWVAKTSLICAVGVGYGAGENKHLTVTASDIVGTRTRAFTFDGTPQASSCDLPALLALTGCLCAAPVVSYLGVANNARTQTGMVSAAGLNFAAANTTPSMRIDTNACGTMVWTSATAANCWNAADATITSTEVSVAGIVGTRYPAFSFDGADRVAFPLCLLCVLERLRPSAPVVSDSLSPNRPFSTALSVTISGLNFQYNNVANVDTTPTVQVALGACATAAWSSASSVTCFQSNYGTHHDRTVHMTVAALVATSIPAFSFDCTQAPLHTCTPPVCTPSSGFACVL